MDFKRIDTTSNRLKKALIKSNKKAIDLSKETGINKGTLSHYLKGDYEPKQDTINMLSKALNVSEMWLWGYDCPMERVIEYPNNDILTDIVIKAQNNDTLFKILVILNSFNDEQLNSLYTLLK